ncbi:MAG: ABC transporter permease, partial [Desulfomonilaceae bacterium]
PFSLMVGAYLWQLLPMHAALALDGRPKFFFMAVVVCLGIYVSYLLGPSVEIALFSGNFKAWLNKDVGSATPLLFALNIPLVAGLLTFWFSRSWGYRYNHYIKSMPMPYAALADLARWLAFVVVIGLIAYALAILMNLIGLDPRKSFFGPYVQRNTLIVGFAMGFAVVPIIYT